MSDSSALWLKIACDTSRSVADRKLAWRSYEVECWYESVHSGRLRLCDLDVAMQDAVYALIRQRNADRMHVAHNRWKRLVKGRD